MIYPDAIAVAFVCAWMAAAPAALWQSVKKNDE